MKKILFSSCVLVASLPISALAGCCNSAYRRRHSELATVWGVGQPDAPHKMRITAI